MLLTAPLDLAALTAAAETPTIQGTYGFDWLHPKKSRCAKVEGPLLAKLRAGYLCGAPDSGSASGKTVVAMCKAKKGQGEYLLLSSAADCKEERETQLANGD